MDWSRKTKLKNLCERIEKETTCKMQTRVSWILNMIKIAWTRVENDNTSAENFEIMTKR